MHFFRETTMLQPHYDVIHRSPVDSHHKGPVTQSFDAFVYVYPNKQLSEAPVVGDAIALIVVPL